MKTLEGTNIASLRWIFKFKRNSSTGDIIKRKPRLIAKEYTQQERIDIHETLSHTLKLDLIRIFS